MAVVKSEGKPSHSKEPALCYTFRTMLLYLLKIVILAVVQGLAELLPVSSSAHVIVAAKLMGLPPASDPEMTLLIVMLHTGTMFAVILYFWRAWKQNIFASAEVFKRQAIPLIIATLLTGAVGLTLKVGIEKGMEKSGYLAVDADGRPRKAEIELLFDSLPLIATALATVGVLILAAGLAEKHLARERPVGIRDAAWIGAVQGLCLPFRGFSRSGATISTGLLLGGMKARVEEFSFALAVIITPAIIGQEVWRLIKSRHEAVHLDVTWGLFAPSLLGMVCAFLAGLLALRWLSRWLEGGRWHFFGVYCLAAAGLVFALYCRGY
jgi:undecaprenyl-diphosphatase